MKGVIHMALGAICTTDPNVIPALACFPEPVTFKPFLKINLKIISTIYQEVHNTKLHYNMGKHITHI